MSRKEKYLRPVFFIFCAAFVISICGIVQAQSSLKGSQAVWILKGAFLGLWFFAFGTLGFLYLAVYRNLRPNTAVGLSVLPGNTTWNPLWWGALPGALVAHCLASPPWPGKGRFVISLVA